MRNLLIATPLLAMASAAVPFAQTIRSLVKAAGTGALKSVAVGVLALGVAMTIAPGSAFAKAKKVPMVDACIEINGVFCSGDGVTSDLPAFISGFTIFNPTNDGNAMLTVMIKGSVPNEDHSVFLCPGVVGGGGFSGCQGIGVLITNRNGNGTFHMEWEPVLQWVLDSHAVALNASVFATILANCGDNFSSSVLCTDLGSTENSIQPTDE